MCGMARGQTGFDYRYWFDNDSNIVHHGHSASERWQMDVDVDRLDDAFHTLHLQIVDGDGVAGNPVSRFFVKAYNANVGKGYYWFDGKRKALQLSETMQGAFTIDVSDLSDGFHTFYYQAVDSSGRAAAPMSRLFLQPHDGSIGKGYYWFDNDRTTEQLAETMAGVFSIDVSHLKDGFHTVAYQAVDSSGYASAPVSRFFVKAQQPNAGTGYYWFDGDQSTQKMSDAMQGVFAIDVSHLPNGFHTITYQAFDSNRIASESVTKFFVKARNVGISEGYYWFDSERNKRQVSETTTGVFSIDVSHLTDGFHTVYYQVAVGEDSILSPVAARSFYKIAVPENLRYRCWIDDDRSTMMTGACGDGPMLVDVSHVSDGVHVMYAQVEGTVSSSVVSRPFIKIPQTEGVDYLKCLCFVDDELYTEENLSADGGIINWDLDVTSLALGLHQIRIQVVTPSGAATATYEAEFERVMTDDEVSDRIHVTVGDDEAEGMSFRVDGVRAKTTDKGIIIRNGKKFLVK